MFLVLKLIGGALLILSTFSVGYYKSKCLYNRRDFLKSFLVFISVLSTNIRYNSDDIFTVINISAENSNLFFLKINDDYNKTFCEIWNEIVLNVPRQCSLKKSDKELLLEFGSQLGKTDVDGQLKHLELYKSIFEKQFSDSQEEISQKSKLYKTMGFFVGATATLMMI